MKSLLLAVFTAILIGLPSLAYAEAVVTVTPGKKAGPKCYTQAEAEAEQGIRIHSELMVIGLNCNHMGQRYGQPLYNMYRQMTADHASLFAAYEGILIKYFEKTGEPNPIASLNTLRTSFANKISNDAAGIRPDIFCSRYAPRVIKAKDMSEDDLRKWAATMHPSHPVSIPLCDSIGK